VINFSCAGLLKTADQLRRIRTADHRPLMERWQDTVEADNKRGVLAGLDKDGKPLIKVKYRPRNGTKFVNRKKDRGFKGYGPLASGLHGNLTTAEYVRLTGPPLAPRRQNSRVITNFVTRPGKRGDTWFVEAAWLDVVDDEGEPFLQWLFLYRDIRGVRPEGMEAARKQLITYVRRLVRGRGA